MLFIDQLPFKISFLSGRPKDNVKEINIYGIKWSDKSVYLDSLTNLCKMMYIYKPPKDLLKDKKLENYLMNECKEEIQPMELDQIEEYYRQRQFTDFEQNLLMKL
jgi:hypothetical protein